MDIAFFFVAMEVTRREKLSETERQTVAKVLALLEAACNVRVLVQKSGQIVRQTSQSSVHPSASLTKHIRTCFVCPHRRARNPFAYLHTSS